MVKNGTGKICLEMKKIERKFELQYQNLACKTGNCGIGPQTKSMEST